MYKARQTKAVLNEIPFQKRYNFVSVDGKQDF